MTLCERLKTLGKMTIVSAGILTALGCASLNIHRQDLPPQLPDNPKAAVLHPPGDIKEIPVDLDNDGPEDKVYVVQNGWVKVMPVYELRMRRGFGGERYGKEELIKRIAGPLQELKVQDVNHDGIPDKIN